MLDTNRNIKAIDENHLEPVVKTEPTVVDSERKLYMRFYILTVWCFFITGFIPDYTQEPISYQTFIRWFFLFLLVVPAALSVKGLGFTYAQLGLTLKNSKNALLECTFIFLLLVPLLLLGKMLAHDPLAEFFSWGDLSHYSNSQLWFYGVSYMPHTIGQEFVARGVGLAFACKILNDYKSLRPIFIVSIIFAAFHVHLSMTIAIAIFLSSLLFGVIYQRQKTLVGVCYLHFILGIFASAMGLI